MRQILVNLLSNAVKFSRAGGTIRVSCGSEAVGPATPRSATPTRTPRGPYIRVEDTGIGITPEQMEQIFQPFVQAEGGYTRTRGGTGLGLTISRHLARLMGGDLTAESAPGEGSAFTLWLPSEAAEILPLEDTLLEEARELQPPHLGAVADALASELLAALNEFGQRLRRDPGVPMADGLAEVDLVDHTSAFLADLARSLAVLDGPGAGRQSLLQDGSEIQALTAELHGKQRARLGWTPAALRREWEILGEVIAAAVRRALPGYGDLDRALQLLGRFLERGEQLSQRSLTSALGAGPG